MSDFSNKLEILKKNILSLEGGKLEEQQNNIMNVIKSLSEDEIKTLYLKNLELEQSLKEKEQLIQALEDENQMKQLKLKNPNLYTVLNLYKFFKTEDGKLLNPDEKKRNKAYDELENKNKFVSPNFYKYDPFESAFDRNIRTGDVNFRDYQKKFIQDWSISAQELVILYYGVGSGKTLIAVNCAEQFLEITKNSSVYFLTPASLVLGTILECFTKGIDPTRKNDKGEYLYNFLSYQQMLRSNFEFNDNSLLIIDEAHNLRNVRSVDQNIKISAMKYKKTGNYNIVGNKLSELLIQNSGKFLRKMMMTGTLLVNSPYDLEGLMAIGYNKSPLLNIDIDKYDILMNSENEFKTYYEGLISYYKIASDNKQMPTKKYEFIPIYCEELQFSYPPKEDAYFINSRNDANEYKIDWIMKFLNKNKNSKTLIYSQFLDKSIKPLLDKLDKKKIKYGFISGELTQVEKLNVVKDYNEDKIKILIFTLSIKEGISFKETDNIIVLQPYWNYAIMEQILARGIRLNSHKQGSKSIINLYFLVGIEKENYNKKWFDIANKIMNNDIKTLIYNDTNKYKEEFINNYKSRDIYIYNKMFSKQEEINRFEKKLLALPRFENVNNNENNDFIKIYNDTLSNIEDEQGKLPTNKEMIELKRKLYKEFYNNNINNINKRITRLNNDTRLVDFGKVNTNQVSKITNDKYSNKETELKNLINKNASIEKLFSVFNILKQEIKNYNAFFTPKEIVKKLINELGIENNKKNIIKVLEPTCGIGNMINELLTLNNSQNLFIDGNEYFNPFYQIGKAIYDGIDNVKFYNCDFWIFENKYEYDYIIGNPPFHINIDTYDTVKGNLVKREKPLYDINFVSKAYNMLNTGGSLGMVISSKFKYDKSPIFTKFNLYLDKLRKKNNDNVKIINLETGFKKDKTITKEQQTNVDMVYIILKKVELFNIDLENDKLLYTKEEMEDIKDQKEYDKEEKKQIKEEKKQVKKENKPETKINLNIDNLIKDKKKKKDIIL